jgi:hypothetical protein
MIAPPRGAELLLEALGAQPEFRDAVLGDLAEEFALRAQRDGVAAARRWYCREAVRAAPHLVRSWARGLRGRDITHLGGIILTSYVFTLVILLFAAATVASVMDAVGALPDFESASWRDRRLLWLELALAPLSSMTGGYIAAWLGHRTPLISALALGLAWSCAGVALAAAIAHVPAWYPVALGLVVIIGTTAGGAVRVRVASSFGDTGVERR